MSAAAVYVAAAVVVAEPADSAVAVAAVACQAVARVDAVDSAVAAAVAPEPIAGEPAAAL